MRSSPVIAAIGLLFVIVGASRRAGRGPADPGLWFAAPYFAFLLSRPVPSSRPELSDDDRDVPAAARGAHLALLRDLRHRGGPLAAARQRPVRSRAAHRASHLADQHRDGAAVDAVRARPRVDRCHRPLVERLEATLTTVDRLEHFEGHLLNWYDTQTLEPLPPQYVSTVDSGNFAAALLALSSGLREIAAQDRRGRGRAARSAGRPRLAPTSTKCISGSSTTAGAGCLRLATASPTSMGAARMDNAFYDLLASEARLASFIAIAKGDVPELHWFHLGRLITAVRGSPVLLSWSATMFEYLMPLLVMRSFPETLLDESCRMAVRRQIDYAATRGTPWGISEIGLHRRRSPRQLPIQGVRRAGPWIEARARRRAGGGAVCDRAGGVDRSGTQRAQPAAARRHRHARRARLLRIDRLHRSRRRAALRPTTA